MRAPRRAVVRQAQSFSRCLGFASSVRRAGRTQQIFALAQSHPAARRPAATGEPQVQHTPIYATYSPPDGCAAAGVSHPIYATYTSPYTRARQTSRLRADYDIAATLIIAWRVGRGTQSRYTRGRCRM